MVEKYSQFRAMLAVTRASLRAIFRSPSAVIFGLGFPLIFILVFGFVSGGGVSVAVALKNPGDTSNNIIRGLLDNPVIRLSNNLDSTSVRQDLERGRIAAVLSIDSARSPAGFPQYRIQTRTSAASADKYPILKMALSQTIRYAEERNVPEQYRLVSVEELPMLQGRRYSMIDFILPGMLGFSLLSAGIFGVAFIFFNLRQTLVLKRFYATPINRQNIVMGEGLSRVLFQLLTAVVIILVGHFVFNFTLVHGFITFLEMLILSFIGLVVFMGFGFIVSSVSKNESSIPPFANLITLPQFLLGGTFFSTDVFPNWLQKVCEILPLKQLNDAMRNVAFEGAHLPDCTKQLGILAIWGFVVYFIAIKTFRWE
ncbi:MAG: ABC transporter permease [Bacteroidetes bacterium]|nr:MAG: ABC transporter permease [Bacteroidota bacterium]